MIACYSWQQFSGTERNKAEVDSKTKQVPRSSILEMQNSCVSPWLTFPSSFRGDDDIGALVGSTAHQRGLCWMLPSPRVMVTLPTGKGACTPPYSATKIRGQFIIICHYFLYSLFLPSSCHSLIHLLPFTPLISLGVPYILWA